jgi:hypothetical protein
MIKVKDWSKGLMKFKKKITLEFTVKLQADVPQHMCCIPGSELILYFYAVLYISQCSEVLQNVPLNKFRTIFISERKFSVSKPK